MRSETILRDMMNFACESFTALLFAVLLLVTGCGSSADYTPRTDLAPPPPFMVSSAGGQEMFGPAIPLELALRQNTQKNLENIEPAAGDAISTLESPVLASSGCRVKTTGFTARESRVSFGGTAIADHDGELSFARLHSGRDSAEMTVRFNFALPSPTRAGCR